MIRIARLYPSRPVVGQDLSREKIVTVPNQSMSILDILRRFTRKEALPILDKEAFYVEGRGDLEKMNKQDLTYLHERYLDALRHHQGKVSKAKAEAEAKAKAEFDAQVELAVKDHMAKSAGGSKGGGESPP